MPNANASNISISKKAVVLVTGASSGFGRLTAEALAKAGHTVYASMRDVAGRNAKNAAETASICAPSNSTFSRNRQPTLPPSRSLPKAAAST